MVTVRLLEVLSAFAFCCSPPSPSGPQRGSPPASVVFCQRPIQIARPKLETKCSKFDTTCEAGFNPSR